MVRRKLFLDGSPSTRHEKAYGIAHIREPKTRRVTGHAAQQHVLLECPGICQLLNTMKSSIPGHRLDTAIWRFTTAQHFAFCQRQLRSLGVSHQHYTLPGSEAVALLIIGFNIVTFRNYDAEVGGPLEGPMNGMFKKARSYSTKTGSPRKMQTAPVLSQISHLVSLQNKPTENPAASSYSHHVATERVEESSPICTAASSDKALPTPSRLSEHFPYLLVTWDEEQSTRRKRTRYGHGHTWIDHVASRARRSRLGAANLYH